VTLSIRTRLSDAVLQALRAADARFRRLLAERDLGDLLTCVAVKA
jgi:hypothetical protein